MEELTRFPKKGQFLNLTDMLDFLSVLAGPCLQLYNSSNLSMVRKLLMFTPFSSNSFTKATLHKSQKYYKQKITFFPKV